MASQLTRQLSQLLTDLMGDGWTVITHFVQSTNQVSYVQSIVDSDYTADPANVKALFIFGNVPIPNPAGWRPSRVKKLQIMSPSPLICITASLAAPGRTTRTMARLRMKKATCRTMGSTIKIP